MKSELLKDDVLSSDPNQTSLRLRRGGASEVRQFVAQKLDAIFRKGLEDFGSPGNCLHQLMVLDFADRLSQTRDPNIDLLLCVSDGLIEQDTISQAFRVNGTIYQLILHDNGKGAPCLS